MFNILFNLSLKFHYQIFPLISQHKEGMELFAKYLSTKVCIINIYIYR